MNLHPVVLDALHVDHGHGQAGLPAGDGAGEDEGVGVTELLPLLAEKGQHLWVAHAEQAGDEEAWKHINEQNILIKSSQLHQESAFSRKNVKENWILIQE